jgi:hypothetical protein
MLSFSSIGQKNLSFFIDTKNSTNIAIKTFEIIYDFSDGETLKLDTVVPINHYIYAQIDSNSYRFTLELFKQYIIKIYDTYTNQEKYITIFTGDKDIDKLIITDFNIYNKTLSILYNNTTHGYDYILFNEEDSVLKEERRWEN